MSQKIKVRARGLGFWKRTAQRNNWESFSEPNETLRMTGGSLGSNKERAQFRLYIRGGGGLEWQKIEKITSIGMQK